MGVVITAWERSPDGGKGLARDTRVRWALEEVGVPYEVRLLSAEAKRGPRTPAPAPLRPDPDLRGRRVVLFETGAIVLHLGERHAGLFPQDPAARALAISWVFAALNTVEPPILDSRSPSSSSATSRGPMRACRSSWIASATACARWPPPSATPSGSTATSAPAT